MLKKKRKAEAIDFFLRTAGGLHPDIVAMHLEVRQSDKIQQISSATWVILASALGGLFLSAIT